MRTFSHAGNGSGARPPTPGIEFLLPKTRSSSHEKEMQVKRKQRYREYLCQSKSISGIPIVQGCRGVMVCNPRLSHHLSNCYRVVYRESTDLGVQIADFTARLPGAASAEVRNLYANPKAPAKGFATRPERARCGREKKHRIRCYFSGAIGVWCIHLVPAPEARHIYTPLAHTTEQLGAIKTIT